MQVDTSLWGYIINADAVVKAVLLLLVSASVVSWTFIFQRIIFLKHAKESANNFEKQFWSGTEIEKLYQQVNGVGENRTGLANIFCAGFTEFKRLQQKPGMTAASMMEAVERAMHIAKTHELENLENHLSFLATIGSTSPYVGLFV